MAWEIFMTIESWCDMKEMNICFDLVSSEYVNRKYGEFYKEHGYIPKIFVPYNCREITDIAPTLTTNCGHMGGSSNVCIIEEISQDNGE